MAIGWLRVRNVSSDPVEILPQKRTRQELGRPVKLAAGADLTVPYRLVQISSTLSQTKPQFRGAWCFCVVRGDPNSVEIVNYATNSGYGKDNLLGMV